MNDSQNNIFWFNANVMFLRRIFPEVRDNTVFSVYWELHFISEPLFTHRQHWNKMAPPTYGDLGKSSRDVFGKGYHFSLIKLDVKTKTPSGKMYNCTKGYVAA